MKNQLLKLTAFLISATILFSCNTKKTTTNEMDHAMPDMAQSDSINSDGMTPQGADHGMMQAMGSSMDKMKDMKMTGQFDADFASIMILHHQSAIDMSEAEVAKGNDAEAKAMAQRMITKQKDEIASLQKFTKSNETPDAKMDHNDSQELTKAMESMMDKMNAMQMTGNADKDFVMMMIPHHEGALTMAAHQVKHGKNAELKKMAQTMITDQEKEIAELKAWQTSRN